MMDEKSFKALFNHLCSASAIMIETTFDNEQGDNSVKLTAQQAHAIYKMIDALYRQYDTAKIVD